MIAAVLVAAVVPVAAQAEPPPPGVTDCDPTDPAACLLPFPDDRFRVPADTPTGRRLELPGHGMPTSAAGRSVQPTEWNRNDGFSPGSMVLAHGPGLDLQATFDLPAGVQVLDQPARSLADDAPIVLLDLDTGRRVPYYAELDAHSDAVRSGHRLLIVRPLETLRSGHRHRVALRSLRDAEGKLIEPHAVFEWYRGQRGRPPAGVEPSRTAERQRLFVDLRKAGVAKDDLYLA